MGELWERAPGHALIDQLLREWELGNIRVEGHDVVIDEVAQGWFRGVLGERQVATRLGMLGPTWTVIHSVPVGSGSTDIDHVAISEAGVFTINTKHHAGKKVWVAGYGCYVDGFPEKHYISKAVAEANRASHLLSRATKMTVPVTGVLAFVGASSLTIKARPAGGPHDPEIRVVREGALPVALEGRPVFSHEQAERIALAAADPSTWSTHPIESTNGSHVAREFDALSAAIQTRRPAKRPLATRSANSAPARQVWAPQSRPAPSSRNTGRPSTRRKRKDSLLTSLVMPLVGLGVLLWWLNSLQGN